MIETAVFSSWTPQTTTEGLKMGYSSLKDFFYSQTLSIALAREHFKTINFVTNDFMYDQLKKVGIDKLVHNFDLSLNEHNHYERYFWALAKCKAYSVQKQPFAHIDGDFIVWDFPERFYNCEFGFQSPEPFDHQHYHYYPELIKIHKTSPFPIQTLLDNPVNAGWNCGIVVTKRLDIVQEWYELAKYYVDKNREHMLSYIPDHRIHLGLYLEQYTISSILKREGIEPVYYYDGIDPKPITVLGNRISHFWGCSKLETRVMNKVKNHVIERHPEIAEKIEAFY